MAAMAATNGVLALVRQRLDVGVTAAGTEDLPVDADDLALQVEQWAARVARIDGRVSLNRLAGELVGW
jgi:hypothetical protein